MPLQLPTWLSQLTRRWRSEPAGHRLDRPIFLVGCCKSGTTMLGSLMLQHPQVGPKHTAVQGDASTQEKVSGLLLDEVFNVQAHEMEQKEIWDRYFPMNGVKLRMGKELTLLDNPLSPAQADELVMELTAGFHEARFFSKHPANGYRLHAIREIFPSAKILAIHRDGRDVVSSWGRKGKRWKQFGGYAPAIETFAQKWSDAVAHIERFRTQFNIEIFRYEEIIADPGTQLAKIFSFCELPPADALTDGLSLRSEVGLWRERIPAEFHPLVEERTRAMREQLGYVP